MSTAKSATKALKARGWTLVTAESCTAGMIAAAMTDLAGSSDVFERGFVTYSNLSKTEMVNVPAPLIDSYGAVSEQVAAAMAQGALNHSAAEIAISVTGIAGPGGSEHKPEGRVCFGCATRDGKTHVETMEFGAVGRANVRANTVDYALGIVEQVAKHGMPLS